MWKTRTIQTAAQALCVLLMTTGVSVADPKPKGAKTADSQTIANLYVGKTQSWESCKGGVYYGSNWQAQAFCSKAGQAVGVGNWSVKRGKVCSVMNWYWQEDGGVGSKTNQKDKCINHVVDKDGQIWRNWQGDKDWWRVGPSSKHLTKGFKFNRKVNRLRKKLGV